MNRTTTHETPQPTDPVLRALRQMPDWLVILIMLLLAFTLLGGALYVW